MGRWKVRQRGERDLFGVNQQQARDSRDLVSKSGGAPRFSQGEVALVQAGMHFRLVPRGGIEPPTLRFSGGAPGPQNQYGRCRCGV